MTLPLRLGLNIDHVATVRNARGGAWPDPIEAARIGIEAGVDGITAHLREDRRHIRDDDIARLRATISKPLNFEMGATPSMMEIALATRPHAVCLVPERREERTTEGGLDVIGRAAELAPMIARLSDRGIRVSLFIEPSLDAVEQSRRLAAPVVELHTGAWCHAVESGDLALAERHFARVTEAARHAQAIGLECHAGHGLNYDTARRVAGLSEVKELNIGHFIIGEAIMVGLAAAVARMRQAMNEGRDA
jgi:pyridoxine 5-phosphate synthase